MSFLLHANPIDESSAYGSRLAWKQFLWAIGILALAWAGARLEGLPLTLVAIALLVTVAVAALCSQIAAVSAALITSLPLIGLVRVSGVPFLTCVVATALLSILLIRMRRGEFPTRLEQIVARRDARLPLLGVGLLATYVLTDAVPGLLIDDKEQWQWSMNFLRYWFGYMALGALLALDKANLRIFFSILPPIGAAALVLYVPPTGVLEFLREAYSECIHVSGVHLAYGTLNSNKLGYASSVFAIASLACALTSTQRMSRVGYFAFWWLFVGLSLLTHSRSAFASLAVGALVTLLVLGRKQALRGIQTIGVGMAIAAVVVLAAPQSIPCTLLNRYAEFLSPPKNWKSQSYELRRQSAQESMVVILETPEETTPTGRRAVWLFGNGLTAGKTRVLTDDGSINYVGSHNFLIDLFVESGIAGVLGFAMASCILVLSALRSMLAPRGGHPRFVAAGYLGALSALAVQVSLSGGTQGVDWIPLLLATGVGVAWDRARTDSRSIHASD